MSRGKLFFSFLLVFQLNYIAAQSDIAPLEEALDTARGQVKYNLIGELLSVYSYRNPKRAVELADEGLDFIKTLELDRMSFLKKKNFLLGWKSHAYGSLVQEEKIVEILDQMFLNADSVCMIKPDTCLQRALTFSYVGNYHFRQRNFEKAIAAHRRAIPVFTEFNHRRMIVASYMNLGMAHEHSGNPDSSLFYKMKGKNLLIELDAPLKTLMQADFEIALAQKESELFEDAEFTMERVLGICKENDFSLLNKARVMAAEIKNANGKYNDADRFLELARNEILNSENHHDRTIWFNEAAIAAKALGKTDSALSYREKHLAMRDSLFEINKSQDLKDSENDLEVKAKEYEINDLYNRLGIQKTTLYILSFLLFFLTGGFLFYYFKNQKQREQNTLEIRYFLSGKPEIVSPIEIDPFLENVLKIIEENLSDPALNVESLAAKIFVSRSKLFKKVKTLSGKSPVALIREIRMEKAKLLLETGEISVGEAATKTGYEDASYFARVFKKYFGKSPSEI